MARSQALGRRLELEDGHLELREATFGGTVSDVVWGGVPPGTCYAPILDQIS
jgi:hypothetical protein